MPTSSSFSSTFSQSSSSLSTALAYASRYRAPLYRYSTFLYFHSTRHFRPPPPSISAVTAALLTSCRRFSGCHLGTGNSLFSRMERFFSRSSTNKNKGMVEHLQKYGVLRSNKVAEVMETVDRALFVPEGTPPYVDSPMPIGYNATISAPHMHAMCLELLENNLRPGMHALDIGSGTGYLTACFGLMVGPEGRAVGVEHIPELIAESIKNVNISAAAHLLEKGSLSLLVSICRGPSNATILLTFKTCL